MSQAASLPPLGPLVWTSLTRPAEAARTVREIQLPRDVLWTALGLVAILGVLGTYALAGLVGADPAAAPQSPALPFSFTPITLAMTAFALMVAMVFVLHFAGQSIGGTGTFPETLTTVAWTQGVFLVLDTAVIGVFVLAPPLGALLRLVALGLMLWCFLHFVAALHRFPSLGRAALCIALAVGGVLFGLAVILAIISALVFAFGGLT